MDWQTLVDKYGDRVILISRTILHDEGLSRDAAQETLMKLGRANGHVDNWNAFVITVAGNTARDMLRRRKNRTQPISGDPVDTTTQRPEDAAIARETKERLQEALIALPTGDRDILLLKFREGLSGPEIARALDLSITAAWQRMSRALKLLRAKLGDSHE